MKPLKHEKVNLTQYRNSEVVVVSVGSRPLGLYSQKGPLQVMLYKADWEQAQERMRAFWANDCIDRPAIALTAPRAQPLPGPTPPPAADDLLTRWTDPDYVVGRADHNFRHTCWAGESLPNILGYIGPGIMASYYGSPVTLHEDTVWFGECLEDWGRDWPRFDPDNVWWKCTLSLTQAAAEAGRGRFFVGITDLGGCSDILASFRGSGRLLMDLIEYPDHVRRLRDELIERWQWCYDELLTITQRCGDGSAQWLGVWAPGKMYNIQSDMCCMISRPMFEEFVAPELEALCTFLDHSLYHLDGPGALHHLDRLLAIPQLGGIQWTPGAGAPPSVEWLDLLRRCQAAGKRIHVHDSAAHAEKIIRSLSPKGLFLSLGGVGSQEEADDLLRLACDWAAGPRMT